MVRVISVTDIDTNVYNYVSFLTANKFFFVGLIIFLDIIFGATFGQMLLA